MTPERFDELVNGPLSHPIGMFRFMRLAGALFAVVQATGDAGAAALESYCAEREARDTGELRE